jgi:hypothetical protein
VTTDTIRHRPPAADALAVDVECWVTLAASKTTGTSPSPLTPARDPAGSSPRCPVTWAGTCRTCRRPIWSSTWPGKGPKYCGADGGLPTMRLWERSGVTKRLQRVKIPGLRKPGSADPPKQRGFAMGFDDAGPAPDPRQGARRGGRPRRHASRQARWASAARAYRARQRLPASPLTPSSAGAA